MIFRVTLILVPRAKPISQDHVTKRNDGPWGREWVTLKSMMLLIIIIIIIIIVIIIIIMSFLYPRQYL